MKNSRAIQQLKDEREHYIRYLNDRDKAVSTSTLIRSADRAINVGMLLALTWFINE